MAGTDNQNERERGVGREKERENAFQVDRDKVRDNDRIQTLERIVCVWRWG